MVHVILCGFNRGPAKASKPPLKPGKRCCFHKAGASAGFTASISGLLINYLEASWPTSFAETAVLVNSSLRQPEASLSFM